MILNDWFRTGDISSVDGDGFLTPHRHMSEVINRGGEKIAPAEIESALLSHPAVAEAAAFGIPRPRLGEDIAAAIIPRPHAQTTPAELRQFLQCKLASFKIPRHILILDRLPKGETGKVQKRQLRELFDERSGQQSVPVRRAANGRLDLEAELLMLWRRLLKSDAVTLDDDFFACGGDSLLAMEMLLQLEQLIGKAVPETILFGAETIRQLAQKLDTETDATTPTTIAQFHTGGNRPPLYFFNGDLRYGHRGLRRMVEHLGPYYPIISVNPHGLGGEAIPASIEQMAADRLPLILERRASGPFLLGGKCNGAMVAFEAARQLVATGHTVHMVAMIDPPTVNARPATRAIVRLMKPIVSRHFLRRIFERLARQEREAKYSTSEPVWTAKGKILPALWDAYSMAMAQYLPASLEVPVTFYAAEHEGRNWQHLCSQLEVVQVPWGHDGCMTVGAERLVGHLRQRINLAAGFSTGEPSY
ncbi:thioesterase domain-containing protein/acyl carrier protein [Bradyrhizobium sp. USDA 4518]